MAQTWYAARTHTLLQRKPSETRTDLTPSSTVIWLLYFFINSLRKVDENQWACYDKDLWNPLWGMDEWFTCIDKTQQSELKLLFISVPPFPDAISFGFICFILSQLVDCVTAYVTGRHHIQYIKEYYFRIFVVRHIVLNITSVQSFHWIVQQCPPIEPIYANNSLIHQTYPLIYPTSITNPSTNPTNTKPSINQSINLPSAQPPHQSIQPSYLYIHLFNLFDV